MIAEDALGGGEIGAFGIAALLGLLELLRVAEKDQAAGCGRDGEDVRQGHLPGLVDEEDVDRVLELLARPQPGGAAEDADLAISESSSGVSLCVN